MSTRVRLATRSGVALALAGLSFSCGTGQDDCRIQRPNTRAAEAESRACARWHDACIDLANYAYQNYCDDYTHRCQKQCLKESGSDAECKECIDKDRLRCQPILKETVDYCTKIDEACKQRIQH